MFKQVIIFVSLVAVVLSSEPEPANRFLAFANTKTVSSVILVTTTLRTTVAKTCYSSLNALSQCRRRRGIEEQPEIIVNGDSKLEDILASKPVEVETTAAPVLEVFEAPEASADLQASSEVEISGLDNCLGRSAFGITIYYTTTTSIILTSYTTVQSGTSSFTVDVCTPANFPYSLC